jgi:uncharacterized protein (TIGR02145 family)
MKKYFFYIIGLLVVGNMGAQNVGIGTLTPVAKLDVIGSIKITDGTEGVDKVLTSDANGLASWQALDLPPSGNSPGGNYPVVWICCNPWMTKNLDVSTYRNGDPIPQVSIGESWAALTTGAYCYYNNDSTTYAAIYGKLYNWYAVNDPRGLAPEGWHIPSDFEWTTLSNCLGGNTKAGGLMKEIGTTHWTAPNTGATNLSNFTGLPGGYRSDVGTFLSIGDFGHWWSSTQGAPAIAWSRNLNYNDTGLNGAGANLRTGFSVRCVRD